MRKIILTALVIAIAAAGSGPLADSGNTVGRRGQSIQVDGFLLEWKRADARPWSGGAGWEWDAIITPKGIAGYFKPASAPACSAWAFDISPAVEIMVTDCESLTTEWQIADAGTERITVVGTSVCGDTLPALVLTVVPPEAAASSWASAVPYAVLIMVFAAVLTAVIVVMRRRGR